MLRISEKAKLLFAFVMPLVLISVMFVMFGYLRIRIFYGERGDALNIMNGIVQGLSTIVAIVFTLILVVVQITIGKYVTKVVSYVMLNWINFLVLNLYVCTIISAICTMWIIHYPTWILWVDVTVVATILCISFLLPFFGFILPTLLKPASVMKQLKNEILDACQSKTYGLMTSKTNLLITTIKKSLEVGEEEYAFEGARYIEEIVEKEESGETRWMFFLGLLSLLDDLGARSLKRNPNFTLRIFEVYGKMLQKLREIPPLFHNLSNSMVQSIMNICRDGLGTKFGQSLAWKSYYLILDVYKTDILLDYFSFSVVNLDPNLRQVLKYCVNEGISERVGFGDFITNETILELLKKEKQSEALHLFQIIFEEIPETPFALHGIVRLIISSKVEGFDSFASSILNMTKQQFKPFALDIIYDPKLGGRSELSISPDYKIVLKTGIEKENEAFLWIKRQMS